MSNGIHLQRVKDNTLMWKAMYRVEGYPELLIESRGDTWDPTCYVGWDLVELNGLNRVLIHCAETLPEMRSWLRDYLKRREKRVRAAALLDARRTRATTARAR